MKIIIAGAGDVGFHLAEHLVAENQDITLIDTNKDVLELVGARLDVLTIQGNSASISTLREAQVERAQLVLAMTTSETTNLMTATLAKRLGANQTIARVSSSDYLSLGQRNIFQDLGIDTLISPSILAAREIERLIRQATFTDVFEFEEGKFTLVGATIVPASQLSNVRLANWAAVGEAAQDLRPMAILRGKKTIIPKGSTVLLPGDHVYFITQRERLPELSGLVGQDARDIRRVMIAGGTRLAYETAQLLEKDYKVTLIEGDKDQCKKLADVLESSIIIHGDPTNPYLLDEVGLRRADAFLALTPNAESNIIASLSAKNNGVYRTIAQVDNREYEHISQNIGVDTLINMKLIAANNVLRYVRKGSIEAITSLHGVDAEVIEYVIERENHVVRHPLRDLHLPETAIIGGVIRGEETFVPDGNFQLGVGDKVIVFALADAIQKLEKVFR
jgi:trk system potassium uptake protein TrkA